MEKSEIKAKWLEALRSGKYKQGKSALQKIGLEGGAKFCCLGVLCDVLGAETAGRDGDAIIYRNDDEGGDVTGVLPRRIARQLEVSDDMETDLISMNDGNGRDSKSFAQIADFIEANL